MYPRSSRQVPLGAIVILSEAKDPWPEPRRLMSPREYYVYRMANVARTLDVGVTGDLYRRVAQHKDGSGSGFTARYHLNRLVYAEATQDVSAALLRQKQLKGWRRSRNVGPTSLLPRVRRPHSAVQPVDEPFLVGDAHEAVVQERLGTELAGRGVALRHEVDHRLQLANRRVGHTRDVA